MQNATPSNSSIATPTHFLNGEWTFWLYTNNKSKEWKDNLQSIISFRSVEDFWSIYNHIELASKLQGGRGYALFRSGTRPAWEDEINQNGGRWIFSLPTNKYRAQLLDTLWLETIMQMIGENFARSEECSLNSIVGAVISLRFKEDKIAIWTAHAERANNQIRVSNKLRQSLGLDMDVRISFEVHNVHRRPKNNRMPNRSRI